MLDEAWLYFRKAFLSSVTSIASTHFQLPRYNAPEAWRERIYCYELYHQLRLRLDESFPYVLHGEIDKRGHDDILQYFQDARVKLPNPDFVLHQPGTMDNLVVIEVKTAGCTLREANEDLDKLRIFVEQVQYRHGIFLMFGPQPKRELHNLHDRISILWHPSPSEDVQVLYGRHEWVAE